MLELARGRVCDRPWGVTLAGIDARRWTCRLLVGAGRSQYCLELEHGEVIAASSPMMSDSVASIALGEGFIAPMLFAEIARSIAVASPDDDEVDVLVRVAGLSMEQASLLRTRVVEVRAARTFLIEDSSYVVQSLARSGVARTRVDLRRVIYLGARTYAPEVTLVADLHGLGQRFMIKPGAAAALACFDFGAAEQPILDALERGATLAELERRRDIDRHVCRAVVYALVSCAICAPVIEGPPIRTRGAVASSLIRRSTVNEVTPLP